MRLQIELKDKFANLSQEVNDKQAIVKVKIEEKIQEMQTEIVEYQVEDDDYHIA